MFSQGYTFNFKIGLISKDRFSQSHKIPQALFADSPFLTEPEVGRLHGS